MCFQLSAAAAALRAAALSLRLSMQRPQQHQTQHAQSISHRLGELQHADGQRRAGLELELLLDFALHLHQPPLEQLAAALGDQRYDHRGVRGWVVAASCCCCAALEQQRSAMARRFQINTRGGNPARVFCSVLGQTYEA